MKPAWSWQFEPGHLPEVDVDLAHGITPEWAWAGSTGSGVKVAVVDSGVDASHPAVGHVEGYVALDMDPATGRIVAAGGPHDDLFGHGTACAGIVRIAAPDAAIYSVRVLGQKLTGRGEVFAAGLRWAIDQGMDVVNLSLSSGNRRNFAAFHRLVDEAVFRRVMLVSAISNTPGASYPSEFAGVFSVASHPGQDPYRFDFNPSPPAEWGAPGLGVQVAWGGGKTIEATGNSFAAPHIAGLIAKILGKHPGLTPFQMKTVLSALASNVGRSGRGGTETPVSDGRPTPAV